MTTPALFTPARPFEALLFGGDYTPEQWPRETWLDDVRLMREAGVNIVSLGIFSWGLVETADGVFDWEWLDEIVALLHENGVDIDLATPTAAPPSWLLTAHPEILVRDADLRQQWQGGRLAWCASSPVFRRYAIRIARAFAERYGEHPAVRMWHIGNEFGGGNRQCFCDESAAAFRVWLERRYGSIDALNAAWGTAFWGHRFTSFAQILPPRGSMVMHTPPLQLDYDRFSSDALLEHFLAEKTVVRELSPGVPIMTNFMVGQGPDVVDYPRWAPHMDVVTNDHYTTAADPRREQDLAFAADRMRGITADRAPWLILEHSTGAASWQPRNRAKDPGEIIRNSLAHVARGSDGAMFFQWRASLAGPEQFHSAMVPHAGERSRLWEEVVELGRILGTLREVVGSRVAPARVALLHDDEAGWAMKTGLKPVNGMSYAETAVRWHRVLFDRGVLVDVIPPWTALDDYDVVVVPTLFLVADETTEALASFARSGGTVVVTAFSGVVDADARVRPGLYPGAFAELLGAGSEEFRPLQEGEVFALENGFAGDSWTEWLRVEDAEVVTRYRGGVLDGRPAITRRDVGSGSAWYVSAALDEASIDGLLELIGERAGDPRALAPVVVAPPGLEAVRRLGEDASFLFLLNHTTESVRIALDEAGHELTTDVAVSGGIEVPAGAVRVVRSAAGIPGAAR